MLRRRKTRIARTHHMKERRLGLPRVPVAGPKGPPYTAVKAFHGLCTRSGYTTIVSVSANNQKVWHSGQDIICGGAFMTTG
jgi:hypothetical protein